MLKYLQISLKIKLKNKKTGLSVCSSLTKEAVKKIYSNEHIINDIKYILHTEPIFSRSGNKGTCAPKLKWYDPRWCKDFYEHLSNIIEFLGFSPYAIEIHPRKSENGKNSIKTLSNSIKQLHNWYYTKYGKDVLIFIENRTNQQIQDGSDIKKFWRLFRDNILI